MLKFFITLIVLFESPLILAWGRHDLLTHHAIQEVRWLQKFAAIRVTPFEQFLEKAFSMNFTEKDFLKQYQLNEKTVIGFKDPKGLHPDPHASRGELTSAARILKNYVDEPDWGMDQNLELSPDQKWMGGTRGPTSQAFRHLYWKAWSPKAPLRTFHIPPREMGEALKRAQTFYNLAEMAFGANEPYWAFRFLAWSLHYIQDLGQPFHSSQILTPKFIAWKDLYPFGRLIKRTTQIISNYHFIYEDYVAYKLMQENGKGPFTKALMGNEATSSSSALLIAKHSSDFSNQFSYEIGESCFSFFGEKFLDPAVDVPSSPAGTYPMTAFDHTQRLSQSEKKLFLKNTEKNLRKTALYTRSLLELAKEEFLFPTKLAD